LHEDLLAWLASCNQDPEAFVLGAFPWGEADTVLEHSAGPEPWQSEILRKIKLGLLDHSEAIQLAAATGHGVGKSTLVSWIVLWAFATAPDTRGVVTANTETQLKTKTWAELGKWFNLFIGRDSFYLTATALLPRASDRERTWRIDQVPWSEKNTEAFAGMHNKGKRLLLIMDEASAIPDIIWEVAEGALTDSDTEIIWLAFGNPTRNTGRFRECFTGGRFAAYWDTKQLDSRTVSITNKTQLNRWVEAYGEDSDFCRIRVKGEFPRHGEMEFISAADVDAAMLRDVTTSITDPLSLGCDVARYGSNESVLALRKGRDARTIPWQYFRGLNTVELATRIQDAHHTYSMDGIFIDGGGVGGGVVDNVRQMHLHAFEVQFGARDDVGGYVTGNEGEKYANKRAAMWGAMRAWIKTGAIPNDPELKAQLVGPTYTFNVRNEILLESKEEMMRRGVESPDRADALALTFAYPLTAHPFAGGEGLRRNPVVHEYNPFDIKHMEDAPHWQKQLEAAG
jgi:hypothetical protein